MRLGVLGGVLGQRALLGECCRDELVSRHGHFDDRVVVAEEAILSKHAHARLFGHGHGAVRRRLIAAQDLEKRGLA